MTELENSAFKVKAARVPNVLEILPEPGAVAVSEHDGRMYFADKAGWNRGGQQDTPLRFIARGSSPDNEHIKVTLPSANTLNIDWGDGSPIEVWTGTDTDTHITHSYADDEAYLVSIYGDINEITLLAMFATYHTQYVSFDRWGELPNLTHINVGGGRDGYYALHGDIASIPQVTEMFFIGTPNVTGEISKNFHNLISAQFISCKRLQFGKVNVTAQTLNFFYAIDCGLTSAEVDRIIASLVNQAAININLHMNEDRTEQSNADLMTLLNAGCTVSVAEDRELLPVGPELYNIEGAIINKQADSKGEAGWSVVGLDQGANIFKSQQHNTARPPGTWAFQMDANPNPVANSGITIETPFVTAVDDIARIAWDWHHVGSGDRWGIFFDTTFTFCSVYAYHTTMNRTVIYRTTGTTAFIIAFRERLTDNNGGMFLDNLSVKLLT